jgi:hypothetical protein
MQVVLAFTEVVTAMDGVPDDTEVNLSAGLLHSVLILDNEMVVNLSGVPDGTCLRIGLTGISDLFGQPLVGDNDVHLRVLTGDTNGDGKTNLIDMAQVKSMNGQPLLPENARFDVNLDGSINLIDMALVKSLNGSSGDCP